MCITRIFIDPFCVAILCVVFKNITGFCLIDSAGDDDVVDPWSVSTTSATGVDYDKLIRKLSLTK